MSANPTWRELPIGVAILEPGCARNYHTGTWRSAHPEWELGQCVRCGVCQLFCPEGCISFNASGYPGADLDYCKGCGICAHECVTACIQMISEEEQ